MEPAVLWNMGLTAALALVGWGLRHWINEINRLNILLNKTREEIARNYVTKQEHCADMDRLISSMADIGVKIDRLIDAQLWDGVTERRRP